MDNILKNFWLNGGALRGMAEREQQEKNKDVLNTKINEYTVDSCYTFDEGYETAIKYKEKDWVITQRYSNKEEIQKGHQNWCDFCKDNPTQVYSVQMCEMESLV